MRKNKLSYLIAVIAIITLYPLPSHSQSLGAVAIVQGGNVANVTAGNSLQTDIKSVNGTTVSGMVAGSVPVTIVSGAGSGGTAAADEAAFTEGTTNFTPAGCYFKSAFTSLTTGQMGTFACMANRSLYVNVNAWGNTALGTPTNFGTTPGAVVAGQVNSSLFIGTVAASTAASGVQKVGIVGNAGVAIDGATGAAPPANGIIAGGLGSGATGGFLTALPVSDTFKNVNISTATTTLIVTGVAGRQVRIGSYELSTAGADNIEWIEGTGATCGTGTAGMVGGTTSGTGYSFLANGTIMRGSGVGTVLSTVTTGDSVCIVTSAAVQLAGHVAYTIF